MTPCGLQLPLETEIARAVDDQFVEFFKGAVVEKKLDAFAAGHIYRWRAAVRCAPAAALLGRDGCGRGGVRVWSASGRRVDV